MRIVIDTNILISFAIRPNDRFFRLFDYAKNNCTILASEETLRELSEVISRKRFFKYFQSLGEIAQYISWYEDSVYMVDVVDNIVACRDPKDDKFLSLAVSGGADCIIAGDNDLLDMKIFQGINIYTPSAFMIKVGL